MEKKGFLSNLKLKLKRKSNDKAVTKKVNEKSSVKNLCGSITKDCCKSETLYNFKECIEKKLKDPIKKQVESVNNKSQIEKPEVEQVNSKPQIDNSKITQHNSESKTTPADNNFSKIINKAIIRHCNKKI